MKEALWGYWLIILGIFIIVVLLLVQSFTSTNTQDYYLVKTITEASMEDAIDWSYYRLYGEVKINKEKFYESFLRRFAEETSLATTYTIEFTEVYEAPPKVGVKVSSKSSTFSIAGDSTTFDIVNKIDAILENRTSTTPKSEEENDTWQSGPIGGTIPPEEEDPTAEVTPINGIRYNMCHEYYITECQNLVCKYTKVDGENKTGTISASILTLENNSECAEITAPETKCSDEYDAIDASGVQGYAMGELNIRSQAKSSSELVKAYTGGENFTIVGQAKGSSDWFLVELANGDCGYAYKKYVAVNMQEFFSHNGVGNVTFDIKNASSSIYAADDSGTKICSGSGECLSGRQFYAGGYKPLGVYGFAQKVMKAAKSTSRTLVINDAYRPSKVTKYMFGIYNDYLDNYADKQYVKDIDNYGRNWFLARGVSKHNTASAIDVTFAGVDTPTKMHVLNVKAADKSSSVAKELKNLFTSVGLTTIKSEWWHFQDDASYSNIMKVTNNKGASFWSAV